MEAAVLVLIEARRAARPQIGGMGRIDQVLGHRAAHVADTDEANLIYRSHGISPVLVCESPPLIS